MPSELVSGISPGFPELSRSQGQVAHVLLTRSPLIPRPKPGSPFDLHVLSTPPAFVLSQDQTLREKIGVCLTRGEAILTWPATDARSGAATVIRNPAHAVRPTNESSSGP